MRQVGEVAYELQSPDDSKVHNVFYVSRLKGALGHHVRPSPILPPLDDKGRLELILEAILDIRERKLRQRTIHEFLVKWQNFPDEDATWETEDIL